MSQEENPFSPPVMNEPALHGSNVESPRDGYISQVPVIGVLMIVQGSLETLYSLISLGMGFVFLYAGMPQEENGLPPWVLGTGMLIFGGIIFLFGLLRIASGISVYRYRRRVLALVINGLGLATMLTCYCAPSAIAICIYSFVVLLQPSVIAAFAREET